MPHQLGLLGAVYPCLVLPCLVLSCLVLSCLVLSCLVEERTTREEAPSKSELLWNQSAMAKADSVLDTLRMLTLAAADVRAASSAQLTPVGVSKASG